MDADSGLVDVEVEFDYEAELSDELTIKVGQVIKDVKRMEGGWWEGALDGKRGVFPDNFVKVLHKDPSATPTKSMAKPSSQVTPSSTASTEEVVQLRRGQMSRASANKTNSNQNNKKCRVLFSYQPKHDDELELKNEDIIDFLAEVEDGWWKGKLRGRVGVFPSNFVEMIKQASNAGPTTAASSSNNEEDSLASSVADKNKRNEKLKVEKTQQHPRPSSKISSLIQDAESKALAKKKSSIENLNLVKRESPLGGEDSSSKSDDLSNAPKLPPKPVKEQCVVLFPYNAVNDDELTLEEGQIINIVTKDAEDKGWWKGEIDGRIGVFPDNFVKLITTQPSVTTAVAAPSAQEDVKVKKPSRPPGASNKLQSTGSSSSLGKSVTGSTGSLAKAKKASDNSANSSREKLNGSSDKISSGGSKKTTPSKAKDFASLPPSSGAISSPKKHSFGKSTPPPKPKPPANVSSTGSLNQVIKEETITCNKNGSEQNSSGLDLDLVLRSDQGKLAHPTAERVKAPKRRPPSSVFQKEAKSSGDAFEVLELSAPSVPSLKKANLDHDPEEESPNLDLKRSASQGSLHSEDNLLTTANRQESKNRLSFKMVRQTMKEALSSFSSHNNHNDKNGHSADQPQAAKSAGPVTKPAAPAVPVVEPLESPTQESQGPAKKPDWLAELSRKQANRRSGLFTNNNEDNVKTASGSSPPKPAAPGPVAEPVGPAKPAVAADKPHIPLKPSQIREEARKSAAFPKRLSSENVLANNILNDKENNKPSQQQQPSLVQSSAVQKPVTVHPPVSKIEEKNAKFIESSTLEPASSNKLIKALPKVHTGPKSQFEVQTPAPSEQPAEVLEPQPPTASEAVAALAKQHPLKPSVTSAAVGWKPSVLSPQTSTDSETELTLEERVKKLELLVSSMKTNYEAKLEHLQKELHMEKTERRRLENELRKNS